jgi:hypothetical protein
MTTGVNERLQALTAAGTSVWLDQIRRGMIESGELARMVEEDSLRGVTSNPAIFEKAILGSTDYDDQLKELAGEGKGPKEIFEAIAIQDVQMACDVLRPVWEDADHDDGFVSIEVMPDIAHDTDATLAQARDYWQRVDRPNLMVKIPGTPEGVPAIEAAVAEGININVTLLFSVEAYAQVAEAWRSARRTANRSTCAASPRSSSRASTPRPTSAWRGPGGPTCSAPPRWRTRGRPTCTSRRSSTATASPSCATPARTSSARCGPRPASRTRTTPTPSTSTT